jgi:hypothetical protein
MEATIYFKSDRDERTWTRLIGLRVGPRLRPIEERNMGGEING